MSETSSRPKSNELAHLKHLWPFLRKYRLIMFGAAIALLVTAGLALSVGNGLGKLVDEGLAPKSESDLRYYMAIFGGLIFLLAIGTFTRYFLVSWLGERVTADIRKAVFANVIRLHPGYFETNHSSEIQSRITTDTEILQTLIGSSVSFALRNVVMFFGALVWLFITNTKLTLIIIAVVPLVLGPIFFFGRKVRRLSKDTQSKIARLGSAVTEMLRNIKTVQAFNRETEDTKLFAGHSELTFTTARTRIFWRGILIASAMFLIMTGIAGMLYVGGLDLMHGRIQPGELTAFIFYAFLLASSVGAVAGVIGDLQRAAGASERLMELLTAESIINEPKTPGSIENKSGEIVFDKVGFVYPTRPLDTVLKKVSFTIEAGKTTALVGPSGGGKSTMLDMMLRFYDPTEGEIRLDGTAIHTLTLDELRSRIAYVAQEPQLFSGTIFENIAYGSPQASPAEVEAAAKLAFAHDFISGFPDGYSTRLGEGGTLLSGGQRQRVALARALLGTPDILLLDEATSALDSESENKIQTALEQVLPGRTAVIVAHRLSTVRIADKIVLVEGGEIRAEGTHQDLIAKDDLYAKLWQLQNMDHQASGLPN